MSKGYIVAQLFTARQARPVTNATVIISRPDAGETIVRTVEVDREGKTEPIEVDTLPKELSLDRTYDGIPYTTYDVTIRAFNFANQMIRRVQVFESETTLQQVELIPFDRESYNNNTDFIFETPAHSLAQADCEPNCPAEQPPKQQPLEQGAQPQVLQRVIIPSQIIVHLGAPRSNAENVYISFPDYIKNVCSSEIYPTWPENAIRANIYAQISLALNRVYTEWYPSQGYNFQITNSTQYDQKFVKGRNIFENISRIVDEIFNVYVSRIGSRGPFFTEYCDGRQVSCPGLKQWGTVDLANQGYSPLEILKYYYGNNIELLETNNIQDIPQSYPGTPLQRGSRGTYVQILQAKLNRIRRNYPLIGAVVEDGVFGPATESAVKTFQSIFNLAQDGVVGKATWYKISYIYVAVTKLAELGAENENLPSDASSYPGNVLREGSTGIGVSIVQFYLSTVNMFYQTVPAVDIDGIYGPATTNAVRIFQRQFNLPQDGIVGKNTWNKLYKIYLELVVQLPGSTTSCPSYPGSPLRRGDFGRDVSTLQAWLSYIADYDPSIPKVTSDGIFGASTQDAVIAFQRSYGLVADGIVGQATWSRLCEVSTQIATGTASDEYPGLPLRIGSSGANVLKMQRYLNYIANTYPNIPRVATDGIFGNATRSAVMAFQRQFGLTADGIIGQQTWNRIVQVYNDLRSRSASQQAQPSILSGNDLPTAAISEEKAESPAVRTADAGRQIRQLRQQMRDLLKEHPELSADRRAWQDDPVMEAGLFDSGAPHPKQS
ncbi:MAG TPA: spore cortex-lytic protein [Ruminococcaceae bacterium]|nr:spore cortex-lytic protein [Oscillospiraceae bacterium]HAO68566.1 spore cortex-lytic protein [Oscillospiraceae bacterium]HCB65122.1 spore cortex-lytic protein [Oscillospiraceae bacterium]